MLKVYADTVGFSSMARFSNAQSVSKPSGICAATGEQLQPDTPAIAAYANEKKTKGSIDWIIHLLGGKHAKSPKSSLVIGDIPFQMLKVSPKSSLTTLYWLICSKDLLEMNELYGLHLGIFWPSYYFERGNYNLSGENNKKMAKSGF